MQQLVGYLLLMDIGVNALLPREAAFATGRAGDIASAGDLPRVVARARRAERQRGLSRAGRRANVRGAFAVRALAAPPRTVCLVDDVYTTGATVAAVATELRRAGAHAVHVVTFARTVRR